MVGSLGNENSKSAFTNPHVMEIGNWKVNYISFTRPTNAHKSPIILLGGAFHTFASLQYEAENLSKDSPVYLVDLPGLGGNLQAAPDLSIEDYAHLIKTFCDNLGIDRTSLIGLSYSSAIAFTFASLYPDRMHKLVLGGITSRLRDSVKHLLEESLHMLTVNELDRFASGIVLNMMNFSQRHNISGSDQVHSNLYQNIVSFNNHDMARYRANLARLIEQDGLPRSPQCPVLVISGEFDNFTTPYENFQVARNCPNSSYVVVKGSDHMVSHEKTEVMTRLYRRFIADQPLNRMKDVELLEKKEFPREKIRLEPRYLLNDVGYLDSGNGVFVPVNIVDINNFGCRLYTSFKDHRSLKRSQQFILHIPTEDMQMEMIIFKQAENGHFRGIFKHKTFERTKLFEGFIEKVASSCSSAYAA